MVNLLAKRSTEDRGGVDNDQFHGRHEEPNAAIQAVAIGSAPDAMQMTGKVTVSIPDRTSASECRSFRANSEDMFVNPFAGPWNDEAILARFKQDLAANPEKFEDLLAAYVRQDPGLAPRLLSLALAKRPVAAIRLASVVAATGALGQMRVLGLFVAAAVTKLLGSSDHAEAANSRPDYAAQMNNAGAFGLMPASTAAVFLLGGGKEFVSSGENSANNRPDASGHGAGSGQDGISYHAQLGLNAAANSHSAPVGSSHFGQVGITANIAAAGSGQLPANSPGNHASANGNAQGQSIGQGNSQIGNQINSQEGTVDRHHQIATDHHSTQFHDTTNGASAETDGLLVKVDDHPIAIDGMPHGKSGGSVTQDFGDVRVSIDGHGLATLGSSDAHGMHGAVDSGIGLEKGLGNPHGGETDAISSFLGSQTISRDTPAFFQEHSGGGGAGYESLNEIAKASSITHDFGLGSLSAPLAQSDYWPGIQPVSFLDAHDSATGGATVGSLGQGLAGADGSHYSAGAGLLSSSIGASFSSSFVAGALNDFSASQALSVANAADPASLSPLPLAHDATISLGSGSSLSAGTSFLSSSIGASLGSSAITSALNDFTASLASSITNSTDPAILPSLSPALDATGLSGNGSSSTTGTSLIGAPSATTGINLPIEPVTSFLQTAVNGVAGTGASGASVAQLAGTTQTTTAIQPFSTDQGVTVSPASTSTVTGPAINATATDTHIASQSGSATTTQTSQSSPWITSGVGNNLADAFSWQGTAGADSHGGAHSALADWAHIGSGHSI